MAAHRSIVKQARDGAEDVSRPIVHELSTILLILGSFYFMTVQYHGGLILSVLVVGLFITDFFEFEARRVDVREERTVEAPKGAIAASLLVLLYAGYQSLFFLIEPLWSSVV